MSTSEIDTSTPEGLREGLEAAGLSATRFSLLAGIPENTVSKWLNGRRPVHPAAAVMLDWLLAGFQPPGWHMTGQGLREAREGLGLSQDELAVILDVETGAVALWESDERGPPGFVARAVMWLESDPSPMDPAKAGGAA